MRKTTFKRKTNTFKNAGSEIDIDKTDSIANSKLFALWQRVHSKLRNEKERPFRC